MKRNYFCLISQRREPAQGCDQQREKGAGSEKSDDGVIQAMGEGNDHCSKSPAAIKTLSCWALRSHAGSLERLHVRAVQPRDLQGIKWACLVKEKILTTLVIRKNPCINI